MPDYSKGKIYKITSGDKIYIGSTCEPTLARRLANHVKDYNKWKKGNKEFVTSFSLIETGQYEITLLELCPCGSKDEMTARERFHIENTVCVNKYIPGRTQKERDELRTGTDKEKERHKLYREKNKDKINEKQRLRRKAKKDEV